MLEKFKMLSVSQLNSNIKLLEKWKALNVEDYPLKIDLHEINPENRITRAASSGRPRKIGKSLLSQKTSVSDAIYI